MKNEGSIELLPGMDSDWDRFRKICLYVLSYFFWCTGLTKVGLNLVSRRKSIIVLNYHRVSPEHRSKISGYYGNVTSSQRFEDHLRFLKRKVRFVDAAEMERKLNGEWTEMGSCAFVTFDDGYQDFLDHAVPILKKYGTKCILFITVGVFEPEFLLPAEKLSRIERNIEGNGKLYLSSGDIEALMAENVEIGSHTISHPILDEISPDRQYIEIFLSKEKLEKITKRKIKYFSYPIGPVSDIAQAFVKEAGYSMAFCNNTGFATPNTTLLAIPRISTCNYPVPVLTCKIILTAIYERLRHLRRRI